MRATRIARLSALGLFVGLFALLARTPSVSSYSANTITNEYITTTGGGGPARADCSAGEVLYAIGTQYVSDGSEALSRLEAYCATLQSDGSSVLAYQRTLGTYGSASGTYQVANCFDYNINRRYAITGATVYKQQNGYVSGIALQCCVVPDASSRVTTGASPIFVGWANTWDGYGAETIACPSGTVARGIYVAYGSLLDKFGLRCGPISGADQSTLSISSSTSMTYGSTLTLTTSGGSGSGAVTYAVTSSGTAGCSVSGSTLSATSVGSCTVTATKAADTNYASITSSTITFTVNKANQSALTVSSTSVTYGSTLALTTSGGSGTGAVSYAVTTTGTAGCSVSGSTLSATSAGSCTVTATKAADTNYNQASSSATTVTVAKASQTITFT
ncbi:MAG: hypothetical protein ACKOFZ_04930, partial [Ilumatobacteraceae bacterium]